MIEPDRALQRHAAHRPLLLRVQRVIARAQLAQVRVQRQRDQVGRAVVEAVRHLLVVGEVLLVVGVEGALVAELQVVRAGDVGHRRVPVVLPHPVRRPVRGSIGQVRDAAVQRTVRRALLGDANETARQVAGHLVAAPAREVVAEARGQQDAVGHRRIPRELLHALEAILVGRGFRRRDRRTAVDESALARLRPAPVVVGRVGRAGARLLLVPVDVELVARCRLQRETKAGDRPAAGGPRLSRRVGLVRPLRGIARVLVRKHARHRRMRSLIAKVQEVPESILLDRAADAGGVVPQLQQPARRAEAGGLQFRRVVAADHAFADAGEEERSAQRVAARLGDDAQ